MKRKRDMQPWMCVHGGTSCSIIAIVGTTMIVANVGDSAGVLCASHQDLDESLIKIVGDAGFDDDLVKSEMFFESNDETKMQMEEPAMEPLMFGVETLQSSQQSHPRAGACGNGQAVASKRVVVLTGDHSPENPSEFERFRQYWPLEADSSQPRLLVVYDARTHDKARCNSVFELQDGQPTVTNRGKYYKNVRSEWASLVATPPSARFQDALAFTRSIGDFHLHTFGTWTQRNCRGDFISYMH